MKYVILIGMVVFVLSAKAQSIERQLISGGGSITNAGTLELSGTLGEPFTDTYTSGTIVLTQGFQQPDLTISGIAGLQADEYIKAYPNPTTSGIFLDLKLNSPVEITVNIFDITGKQVLLPKKLQIENTLNTEIDFSSLLNGAYIIQLQSPGISLNKQIKIVKAD